MEGASSSAAGGSYSSSWGREPGRVGATNIGRLRPAKQQQQHATRAAGVGISVSVTSWHLRVFAAVVGFMGCVLLAASLAMSALHQVQFRNAAISRNFRGLQVSSFSFFLSFLLRRVHTSAPRSSRLYNVSVLQQTSPFNSESLTEDTLTLVIKELKQNIVRKEQVEQIMHGRLLQMATSALTMVGPFDDHTTHFLQLNT
jgi:hypothetical protein